ncbi:MAG: DUF2203 family protein [bacterium]
MAEVFRITQPRLFSIQEAEQLLPVVRKITKEAVDQFLLLEEKLKHFEKNESKWKQVEGEISDLLNKWSEKISKLGAHPKGIWLIDFDNGEGYYCWRYDEERIEFSHGYQDGFGGRTAIS